MDGRIRVWEINTDSMILNPADRQDPRRRAAHGVFARKDWVAALNHFSIVFEDRMPL